MLVLQAQELRWGDFSCTESYKIVYTSTISGVNLEHKRLGVSFPCQLTHEDSSVLRGFVTFEVLEFYGAENL
jgi:hypothetical protein